MAAAYMQQNALAIMVVSNFNMVPVGMA
jgi:hypothetical protein